MAYLLNLLEFGAKDLISNLDGISTFLVIFSRLENRFKWITKILGNLNMVMSFSILSTALHFLFWHRYPIFSILSVLVYSSRQSFSDTDPKLLGIYTFKSMKLSKL